MATGHHLSVVTNSSVKPPIHPMTGLSRTVDERQSGPSAPHNYQNGHLVNEAEAKSNHSGLHISDKDLNAVSTSDLIETSAMMDQLHEDLGDLSDDEFYKRLMDLKNQHRKTLNMCEAMYQDKLSKSFDESRHVSAFDRRAESLKNKPYSSAFLSPASKDVVKDMSSKPPTGRYKSPHQSNSRRYNDQMDKSFDSLQDVSNSFSDADMEYSPLRYQNGHSKVNNSLSQIEDMWDNFSVDDYAPRTRKRSNSLGSSNSYLKQNGQPIEKEWRHKITIPEPFTMTKRESQMDKIKSKSILEFERERAEKEILEKLECQKKFKAQPVPAHVYLPLYDEIMEDKETRSRYNKEYAKEVLQSMEKPFNFVKREEEKKRLKKMSPQPSNYNVYKPKQFKAKPAPNFMQDESTMDKLAEEEEYRKIRVRMRAEEMLRQSSLPPSMKARGREYTEGKSRQKMYAERAKKAGFTKDHKFKPSINDEIPDFDTLYKRFQKDLYNRKKEKEYTVCKPFNLRTSQIEKSRHKIYDDIQHDEETLHESRWPFKNPRAKPKPGHPSHHDNLIRSRGSLSSSLDSIPARMTASAELRSSRNRELIEQRVKKQIEELEKERRKRQKERMLKSMVSEKALANDNSYKHRESYDEKLKKFREAERARREEYRQELNEIRERVDSRPLLFERTSQINAKHRAERQYREKLRDMGIDEDEIRRQSSLANEDDVNFADYSSGDDDDYRNIQNETHTIHARTPSPRDYHYDDDFVDTGSVEDGY